jgi:hypothetical protein
MIEIPAMRRRFMGKRGMIERNVTGLLLLPIEESAGWHPVMC